MKMTAKQIDCLTASIKTAIQYSLAMLEPEPEDGGDVRDNRAYELSERISLALEDELRRHWWHPQTAAELREQLAKYEAEAAAQALVSPKPENIDTSERSVVGDDTRRLQSENLEWLRAARLINHPDTEVKGFQLLDSLRLGNPFVNTPIPIVETLLAERDRFVASENAANIMLAMTDRLFANRMLETDNVALAIEALRSALA